MCPSPLTIQTADADDAAAVRALAEQATAEAGSPVLNEQSLIALAGATDTAPIVLIARAGEAPVAAAVIEVADAASTLELVLPDGADAGPALLDAVLADDRVPADRPVLLWAHGRGSRTAPLAEGRGYEAIRSLYVLRRPGSLAVEDAPLPPGVELSTFRPGVDNADWLAVNAAAFATHAEQGRWSAADLQARIDEDWFDAAGFFLARSSGSGELLGFHWTKTERAEPGGPITVGEVYVIGIAPAAAGLRLGSALLAVGLRHLQDVGAPVVDLYVDGDNTGARALYANRGFAEHNLDVCYRIR
ncbi:MAG: mycothiol biosynthesis acetyltransferase [Pseudonocardiales bacterium]|nr:mycothiol biosynthesis acetyltransferase [Pseudonocardiales bacterium]